MPQFIDTVLFIFIIYCIYKRFSLKNHHQYIRFACIDVLDWFALSASAYESHHKSDNFRYSNIYHLFII